MTYDVYMRYSLEHKIDENTTRSEAVRKEFKKLNKENMQHQVLDLINNLPDNISEFYMAVDKSYEEQLDSALKSI